MPVMYIRIIGVRCVQPVIQIQGKMVHSWDILTILSRTS